MLQPQVLVSPLGPIYAPEQIIWAFWIYKSYFMSIYNLLTYAFIESLSLLAERISDVESIAIIVKAIICIQYAAINSRYLTHASGPSFTKICQTNPEGI